ncbi:processed acidic surface protein [Pullulanibacillus pueri]|uniref:Uncharacterized protein n=1 Tax=Pullulanibacillus pueri TaxID=1437324 RepID=A0A8J3EMW8_9BACL|nr:processed acidic surface protein [Pullulanibacillus pueri]MBM7682850.1 processed acidic surface protein [Pullulanibacillus pueri]GGH84284.1 hypothetical protein GCM10007096_27000 [Pullulanibacillus pueri]
MKKCIFRLSLIMFVFFVSFFLTLRGAFAIENPSSQESLGAMPVNEQRDIYHQIGLTQAEINRLMTYIASLDLDTIIPQLTGITNELNALRISSEEHKKITLDGKQLLTTINEMLDLLQLDTDVFFVDGQHHEPFSLKKMMATQYQNKKVIIQLLDQNHHRIADLELHPHTVKEVAGYFIANSL